MDSSIKRSFNCVLRTTFSFLSEVVNISDKVLKVSMSELLKTVSSLVFIRV